MQDKRENIKNAIYLNITKNFQEPIVKYAEKIKKNMQAQTL